MIFKHQNFLDTNNKKRYLRACLYTQQGHRLAATFIISHTFVTPVMTSLAVNCIERLNTIRPVSHTLHLEELSSLTNLNRLFPTCISWPDRHKRKEGKKKGGGGGGGGGRREGVSSHGFKETVRPLHIFFFFFFLALFLSSA